MKIPKNPISGLLLVDKPKGLTSHDVVSRIRKALGTRAVGHAGTLDPLASGLLVIMIGEATKLSNYILPGDKRYLTEATLGLTSETLDTDGEHLEVFDFEKIPDERIVEAAMSLSGEFEWPVPDYSAVKVDGKKLYDYARSGQEVPKVLKTMSFDDVRVKEIRDKIVEVEMACTKGSYIRSWVDQLGKRLEVPACVSSLRRTWSDPYNVDTSIKLEEFEALEPSEKLKCLIPLEKTLPTWPSCEIHGHALKLLRNGNLPAWLAAEAQKQLDGSTDSGFKVLDRDTGQLVSLLLTKPDGRVGIGRVFLQSHEKD